MVVEKFAGYCPLKGTYVRTYNGFRRKLEFRGNRFVFFVRRNTGTVRYGREWVSTVAYGRERNRTS